MSVVTGSPVRLLTVSSVLRPSCSPGPRNDLAEVRLALSKEALKTSGIFKRCAMAASRSAIHRVKSCDSMTQGPAIHSSGWPAPQVRLAMGTVRVMDSPPGASVANCLHFCDGTGTRMHHDLDVRLGSLRAGPICAGWACALSRKSICDLMLQGM